ncbi:MAG: patatin-like phospholipase family protein [Deltaproteobacteria bacterium]|nr:patatin-like phospholipase family protein [Deltaproteobacteria bacterium]MBW2083253.1 patatin-like phospholipase family protein [Deltaproteobacteria bacterium]MBW2301133.1 patatin-like phospholipase family protein [Deltaproteobacteria bacterium]
MSFTEGQKLALEQLLEIEATGSGALEIVDQHPPDDKSSFLIVHISIDCNIHKSIRVPEGLPIRNRERLKIYIPPNFPFFYPKVCTIHKRFAGFPHVQWCRYLCLYQASSTEWNPSDGMYGFLERLDDWLEKGALNQLDPEGAPLHPPVTYTSSDPGITVIPTINAPKTEGVPWLGLAHLNRIHDKCVEIVNWTEFGTLVTNGFLGAVILLDQVMPFEFPSKMSQLLNELKSRGVPWALLLNVLQWVVIHTPEDLPLFIILGTPMRGISGGERKQHLVAWWVEPVFVKGIRLSLSKYSSHEKIQKIGHEVENILLEWAEKSEIKWCRVREDRPEIVTRRDHASSVAWFKNRKVTLWGCGALGAHLAEFLVRAGVQKLVLHDYGVIAPGLLVRQPYERKDIGRQKVRVLEEKLKEINPSIEIVPHTSNLVTDLLAQQEWNKETDLIIDTTASRSVSQCIELKRPRNGTPPPIASMIIGHNASRGILVFSPAHFSGGPQELFRRAKLEASRRFELRPWLDDFWPEEPRTKLFQPEPGCSDATFVGSQADVTALAGTMLNFLAKDLARKDNEKGTAHFVANSIPLSSEESISLSSFEWNPYRITQDPHAEYEIRISEEAWSEISGWIEKSRRSKGTSVETGGVLFGERNDAAKVIWIDEILGPPPDSEASFKYFKCGFQGVEDANQEKIKRTRGSVRYQGLWHTHPDSMPIPSATDIVSMKTLSLEHDPPHPRTLMIIVGQPFNQPTMGAFLFKTSDFKQLEKDGYFERSCAIVAAPLLPKPKQVAISLSGGGFRAVAFHLGCLRALHDRGILDQVEVISGVSGGSIIAAMYAYSNDSFRSFENRVLDLLRNGLVMGIARRWLLSYRLLGSLSTLFVSGIPAITSNLVGPIINGIWKLTLGGKPPQWINRIRPPFRRWISRTNAFERALADIIFANTKLTDKRRDDIDIVVNACDLSTGSAFRFGSRESGCYRLGHIKDNDIKVSEAVAASAAFPILLPVLDKEITFVDRDGRQQNKPVFLTDGGVFDNLGISCFEPSRSERISYNVFHPDYIIACSAGAGIMDYQARPYWWPARMTRSFDSIYRKFQDGGYKNLHQLQVSGQISGFILAYLGQLDHRLPYVPPDLITRDKVYDYPTNFSPMSQKDIDLITQRGEQLIRLLVSHYCPEL